MEIIATAELQCSTRNLSARRPAQHNLELLYYCWAVFTLLEFNLEDPQACSEGQLPTAS